ncbi:hypothetical protein DK842_14825 [Chromobacterium phragmitis]|uniref:hypothetical protein n=1 Tax=Chromobacterium phragmitis TaxID=2202141 RepID=UPI000DEC3ED9|nr:hypothetical protein [Chromobacterium phragmitis]AXE31052.1 hypothetical protein DK842_14825 [Chromobacterium phragmitis]
MNPGLVKKTTLLTFIALSTIAGSHAYASKLVTSAEYRALLPKTSNQYEIKLGSGSGLTVRYHCNIKDDGKGGYALDPAQCQSREIDFKKSYPNLVSIPIGQTQYSIEEHKLWAMAFAHAAMNSMVIMQYGLNKTNGTFNLSKPFGPNKESFGDYFMRNMGPNYYLSKGLQESSLGDDLQFDPNGNDGVLQVEYPGSAWSELQGIAQGGFPAVFSSLDPKNVLDSNSGPARNILGSATTSAYYNGSATAINTGSLPWADPTKSTEKLPEFIQSAKDPNALAIMLSFMYNRGPYAAKDQPLKNDATFQQCQNTVDLPNNWNCFTKQNDFGTRYMRQIPDVSNQLFNSGKFYDTTLTRNDVTVYLYLLALKYGFYSSKEYNDIYNRAMTVFGTSNTISFKKDFGRIIETVFTTVPIKTFGETAAVDPSKKVPVTSTLDSGLYMSSKDQAGVVTFNDWLTIGKYAYLPKTGTTISTMKYNAIDCTADANAWFKNIANDTSSSPQQLTVGFANGKCTFKKEPFKNPPAETCKDGEWCPTKEYPTKCTTVKHKGYTYQNEWHANKGEEPTPAGSENWGVWRIQGSATSTCH